MNLARSSARNLIAIVIFMMVIFVLATLAYMGAGWNFDDSLYMVLLTVYSVGYEEVHPVDTLYLHLVTTGTMVLGCTGMIVFTGALVQFLTANQLQQMFGGKRMDSTLSKMSGHVILVGLGRIGVQLAQELQAGGREFVILERSEKRCEDARAMGYLCLTCDATDEDALLKAGIKRASILATVLPDDAANVFITLSARAMNPEINIIARGELPSTESKLFQAGANKVVLPTHIGAERMAEIILYPETARFLRGSEQMRIMERSMHTLGLEMDVIIVPENSPMNGLTVAEIEQKAEGAFFVVQVNFREGEPVTNPDRKLQVHGGDGLVVVGRSVQSTRSLFEAAPAA